MSSYQVLGFDLFVIGRRSRAFRRA